MTQATAPMSPAIKFITGLVLVMTVVLLIAGLKVCGLLLGGAILATVVGFCYLYAPIAYELTGDQLTVRFRVGQKVFPAVTRCATLTARPPWGCGSGAMAGCLPPRAFFGTRRTASTGPMSPAPGTRTMSWSRLGPKRS